MAADVQPVASRAGTRPDVAARLGRNKELDCYTLKKTLHQFCKKEARDLAWDDTLLDMNQVAAECSLLASFYALRQMEAGRPLAPLNQEFYQTCFSLVSNRRRTKFSLREQCAKRLRLGRAGLTEEVFQHWLATAKIRGKKPGKFNIDLEIAGYDFMRLRNGTPPIKTTYLPSGWFQPAALQLATNTQNSIVANFAKRLRAYVEDKYELSKRDANAVVRGVFAVRYTGDSDAVKALRGMIKRTSEDKVSWEPHEVLPVLRTILLHFEKRNKDNQDNAEYVMQRVFGLLPTKKGFEASYFTMNSTAFRGLLLRSRRKVNLDLTVCLNGTVWTLKESIRQKNVKHWTALSDLWWHRFFRIGQVEKEAHGTFAREISTDGYGVSVHLNRPKRGEMREQRKRKADGEIVVIDTTSNVLGPTLSKIPKGTINNYDLVWGIDPGRTDFITATNNEGKSVRFRSTAYRSASGFNRSNRRIRREIGKSRDVRELIKVTPTKKTANLEAFKKHIEFFFKYGRKLLSYFYRPIFRKLRFRRHTQKTRQLDRACNELIGNPNNKTIIGFGDSGAAYNSVIKNCPAGPVKMFARRLARRCEVVVVDEFRTSRVHFDCDSQRDLENQKVKRVFRRDDKEHVVNVHKVLHCIKEGGGCGRTVDRDVNAAKNILSVLMCQLGGDPSRPQRLQRRYRETQA